HAVFSDPNVITQTDGTAVTAEEAASTPEFEYNGVEFVLVVEEEVEIPVEESDGNEVLGFPELPENMEIVYPGLYGWREGAVPVREILNINQDNLLPLKLGQIEQGISETTDSVGYWGET